MKTKVVVFGAGGHAKVAADILRLRGFEVCGFIDEPNPQRRGEIFCGATVLGGRDQLPPLRAQGVKHAFVGFGHNEHRKNAGEFLIAQGFELLRAIHPSAILGAGVTIGAGSLIAAGAVVNPSTTIGLHVIVNTCASVDHDCIVEDGASIGPGARLAGQIFVGRGAHIGIGASIIERKRIGAGSIVGAGAVVIADVPDGVVVAGVPARIIKQAH